ncbi:MAG TPA: VCBS repeat-containing protein, partial [Planctomycetota bacterium]|nr:VCBS repeat-containing protein [Planctomycetota bacterium]
MSPSRAFGSALLAAVLLARPARAAGPAVLEVRGEITSVEAADLDGDGAQDLLVFGTRREAGARERFLAAFYRRDGRYPARPQVEVRVPPDVVLAGVGDVLPAPGEEVLVFTPKAVWRVDLAAKAESGRFRKLADVPSFFFYGDPERVHEWDLVGDLDGDGAPEVVVPAAEHALAVLRPVSGTADALVEVDRIDAPAPEARKSRHKESGEEVTVRIGTRLASLDLGKERAGRLFARSRRAARPYLVDLDGDGRAELVVGAGGFRLDPAAGGRHRRALGRPDIAIGDAFPEKAVALRFEDVDGDRAPDLVYADVKFEDQASTVIVRRGKLTAGASLSFEDAQELKIDGLVLDLELADVDGDGRADLVVTSYRLDLLRNLAPGAAPEAIDMTWSVFLAGAGGAPGDREATPFGRKRALGGTLSLKLGGDLAEVTPISFGADFDGDGRRDALVWDSSGRVRVQRVEKPGGLFGGDGLQLAEAPIFEASAPGAVDVAPLDVGGGAKKSALLVRYRSKLEVE